MIKKILIAILIFFIIGLTFMWSILSKEHKEIKNLSLQGVNFNNLKDGTYYGEFNGGNYHFRSNKIKLIIKNNKISNIELIKSSEFGKSIEKFTKLAQQVLNSQSLHVDGITGATITTKAHLKSIYNALIKANK